MAWVDRGVEGRFGMHRPAQDVWGRTVSAVGASASAVDAAVVGVVIDGRTLDPLDAVRDWQHSLPPDHPSWKRLQRLRAALDGGLPGW